MSTPALGPAIRINDEPRYFAEQKCVYRARKIVLYASAVGAVTKKQSRKRSSKKKVVGKLHRAKLHIYYKKMSFEINF